MMYLCSSSSSGSIKSSSSSTRSVMATGQSDVSNVKVSGESKVK